MGSMKVHHQLAREPSLTLACKRLRPLAPKLNNIPKTCSDVTTPCVSPCLNIKSFIKPESGPRKVGSSSDNDTIHKDPSSAHVETHIPGGTRWNPTQEQIGILEMLYRSGMRTPNAQQIEQITGQLSKYGKIEGKNVFYWFQNHKARERQKQKRNTLGLRHNPPTLVPICMPITINHCTPLERHHHHQDTTPHNKKNKCGRICSFDECLLMENQTFISSSSSSSCKEVEHRTLQLFPLHPEK